MSNHKRLTEIASTVERSKMNMFLKAACNCQIVNCHPQWLLKPLLLSLAAFRHSFEMGLVT
jgi:hypothetical protein